MMKLSDYDFQLPAELIAQAPAPERDSSRLMVVDRASGTIRHETFIDIRRYLADRPVMAFNDTRVFPARLCGHMKNTGKSKEILLVREQEPGLWTALVRGLAKIKPGTEIVFGSGELTATLVGRADGDEKGLFRLVAAGGTTLAAVIGKIGLAPLPPYIRRGAASPNAVPNDATDKLRYQTVYAKETGAIAAPTAGLHFSLALMEDIRAHHAECVFLTLHVGPGTFTPLRVEEFREHRLDKEFFRVPAATWNSIHAAKAEKRPILAVGTTSTRVIESLDFRAPVEEDITGWTDRFIYPGQTFATVTRLLTNFHLPKSSLYLLVCAFAGKELMERAYTSAIAEQYRFFSYGDAMLIL
jgi:S-adenosylmethionine:tRNA ribosyltransferase-isomerase